MLAWEAAAQGQGLPAEATEKLAVAIGAAEKVQKMVQDNLTKLKEKGYRLKSDVAVTSFDKLVVHKSQLRAEVAIMIDEKTLGVDENGKNCTCESVIIVLLCFTSFDVSQSILCICKAPAINLPILIG